MIYGICDVLVPVFVHMVISNATALAFGRTMDSALLTTVVAALTLPVLVWMYRRDRREEPYGKADVPWWGYLLAAAAGIVMNVFLSTAMNYFAVTEKFSNAAQEGLLRSGAAAQIAGLGLLVPVMEEYLFRGLVYRRLKKYLPVWGAVLAGAGIFALYHGNIVQMIFAFPMALAMLLLYEKWDSLRVPIVFHMAVNLSTVLYSFAPNAGLFR